MKASELRDALEVLINMHGDLVVTNEQDHRIDVVEAVDDEVFVIVFDEYSTSL